MQQNIIEHSQSYHLLRTKVINQLTISMMRNESVHLDEAYLLNRVISKFIAHIKLINHRQIAE